MSVKMVLGVQWGDEAKGKITDLLSETADIVVRCSGGNNAGHTIVIDDEEYKLHLIPSGIFMKKDCYITDAVVIDPIHFLGEIEGLRARDIDVSKIRVSPRCHLVMPYHIAMDVGNEATRDHGIGTTKRGIGPVFGDKMARWGIRIDDFLKPRLFREKIEFNLKIKNFILKEMYGQEGFTVDEICDQILPLKEKLSPFIADTSILLRDALKADKKILFEGAQGTFLDIDYGTYPFVTSSCTTAAAACIGTGIPPHRITDLIGVCKAYTTRVGEGPFPTEQDNGDGDRLREAGKEFGTTTGRPRRCGWLDLVMIKKAVWVNGLSSLAITKVDVMDEFETIKVCVGYKLDGKVSSEYPGTTRAVFRAVPVYEELPGWQTSTRDIKDYASLPENLKNFIGLIERFVECKVKYVGVGPKRMQAVEIAH